LILDGTSHRTGKVVGFIGALIAVVFVTSTLDAVVSGYREPKNTFRAFPGTSSTWTESCSGRWNARPT
jgi:hypothetical protein